MMDLDRYYTPDAIADGLIEATGAARIESCADGACGDGSLLRAAERAHAKRCVGTDVDRTAIARLRSVHPSWRLGVADALHSSGFRRMSALAEPGRIDWVAANPPFSFQKKKALQVKVGDEQLDCGVAFAHLLRNILAFRPKKGFVAILPESAMYSEVDADIRAMLGRTFRLEAIQGLKNTTFRGTRANALIVRGLAKKPEEVPSGDDEAVGQLDGVPVAIVRGGVPIFEVKRARGGSRLIHSSNIGSPNSGPLVAEIGRGIVEGWSVLVPRVGVPTSPPRLAWLRRSQLSDCVIALNVATREQGRWIVRLLVSEHDDFQSLYRGTGARYVTLKRLADWLAAKGARAGISAVMAQVAQT